MLAIFCLTLILFGAPVGGATGNQSPTADDLGATLKALERGLVKVKDASKTLVNERALAKQRGVPAKVETLIPALRTESDNAAPIYRELTTLLKDKPLGTDESNAMIVSAASRPSGDAHVKAAKILSERDEITKLIHRATDRPRCRFRRNWALGHNLEFPEFVSMRLAARWLAVEADLLARKGRFDEAVRVQTRGFRVAAHAAEEPIQIPVLVGAACQNITLAGMVNLLEHAESLPSEKRLKVHAQIREAIVTNRIVIDPQRTIRGETAWMAEEFRLIRRGGVAALSAAVSPAAVSPSPSTFPKTAQERAAWQGFMDASEAEYLKAMRQLANIMVLPRSTRVPRLKSWDALAPSAKGDPTQLLRMIMQPMGAQIDINATRSKAQLEAVLAMVAVLQHSARTGQLPATLERAPDAARRDPFGLSVLKYRRDDAGFVIYSIGPSGSFVPDPNVRLSLGNMAVWFPRRLPPAPPASPAPK